MNNARLHEWANRHAIAPAALTELLNAVLPAMGNNTSEEANQANLRLSASKEGVLLWRNNVGAFKDERGIPVRYGLCNESKAMNESVKSSDLIGIRRVLITPDHVGQIIGQFVAREVKRGDWKFSATPHELAQLNFLRIVNNMGGDGKFSCGGLV